MRGLLRGLLRGLKVVLLFVLTIVILLNLFIVLSGRFYLYKGVYNTYLQGKTGPDIYDLTVFPTSTIHSDSPVALKTASRFNQGKFLKEEETNLKSTETTAFLIYEKDSLLFEHYFENHEISTVSNAFSAAKTVVGLLVGIALQEGKIKSLDDRVGEYLPAYKNEGRDHLTIRHLLYMSSGLSWSESGKNPLSDNAESYYGEDLYGLLMRQKQVDAPGKVFKYQSGNSQLLGFVVEKATGKNLSDYCEEKLWQPLGADFPAYWSLDKENGSEKAFCCLYASARDYVKLGALILNDGYFNGKQIIAKDYMQQMTQPAPIITENNLNNSQYGMHIWLTNFRGKKVIYCRGILGQYVVSIPEDQLVFVRLGHKRKSNFTFEEYQKGLITEDKIEHPRDIYEYLEMVYRLKESSSKED